MKISLEIELEDIMKKPMDEITPEDDDVMEECKAKLPRNAVKLDKGEEMMNPGTNAKPLIYTVRKGDTLKSIASLYMIPYGELSNFLMNTEGTTSIHEGMEIKIPRYFQDLSEAE